MLAFYMIHEIPDQEKLFQELKAILNPDGKILIVEPNFHVTTKAFEEMLDKIKNIGYEIIDQPKMFLSRTVVLRTKYKVRPPKFKQSFFCLRQDKQVLCVYTSITSHYK